MALLNYSLPFGAINAPPTSWATISPIHASPHAVNNLYEPALNAHRQENVLRNNNDDYYQKNGPYRHHHPQQQQPQQTQNSRNYLPPPQPQNPQNSNNRNGYAQSSRTRTYGESSYSQQQPSPPQSYSSLSQSTGFYSNAQNSFKENPFQQHQQKQLQQQHQHQTTKAPQSRPTVSYQSSSINNNNNNNNKNYNLNKSGYPQQPPGFKPIQAGHGSRTQNGKLHALK